MTITMQVSTSDEVNSAGIRPRLAHVDVIGGPVTGPVSNADQMYAPGTRVLQSFDTSVKSGTFTLTHTIENVQADSYIRFRGSDGRRNGAGFRGADVDPHGPIRHGLELGDANPWLDTWFYANPIFLDVVEAAPSPSNTAPSASNTAPSASSTAPSSSASSAGPSSSTGQGTGTPVTSAPSSSSVPAPTSPGRGLPNTGR